MATKTRPAKPYPDFPLFPHATGRWCKKIRGKHHYFGPWSDPDGALAKYLDQRDDLQAGRTPRVNSDGLTVRDGLNAFMMAKERQLATGEIRQRTFLQYRISCTRVADLFGLTRLVTDLAADDFERLRASFAQTNGPVALGNHVMRVRTAFKYLHDSGLIDRPIRFGPHFTRPNQRVLRKARLAKGPRMFEAAELRSMLDTANPILRTMLLLGVNCAFGNHDIATLSTKTLDLSDGWVTHPRPKTAIERRCPLWNETIQAVEGVVAHRPKPKERRDRDLVFLTARGSRWDDDKTTTLISRETRRLLKRLGIYRPGVGFYALRHTFETIGGDARDQVAVDHVMGHADRSMAAAYRERIDDDRLRAVVQHVHAWLFEE